MTVRTQAFALEQKLKTFGSQLDALVRAHRTGLAEVNRLAEALATASLSLGQPTLTLMPTRGLVGDFAVLEADEEVGRWLLATFMAGVRTVRFTTTTSPLQLVDFTRRIAELKVANDAIQDFHDWLWADGAEGVEVELLPSFVESVEIAGVAELHAAALALRGEHSAAGDGRSLTIDSRELDTAAARPEFDVPLAALAEAISTRQLEVTGPEFTRGRASVEDAAMWAEAELDVVLSHPALRAAVPTSRLARAIQTRCASACDAGLLRLFAKLFSQPDEFTRALAQGLLNDGLGATIGSALRLTDDAVAPELCALWKVCPSLGTTLLPRLLARAEKEPAVVALLTQLIEGLDRPTVLAAVALEGLGTAEARALLAGTQPAGPALRTFLEALAPPVAAELLATLPASSWNAMSAVSLKLMKSGAPLVATRLMGRALEEEQALKPFIPALLESHARGLDEAMVKRLAARLLSERAEHVVVGLALTRAVTERTRLTCLEALSSRPALTAEVSRFRVAELFDPPAVRDRLRIMRRLSRRRLTLDKSRP